MADTTFWADLDGKDELFGYLDTKTFDGTLDASIFISSWTECEGIISGLTDTTTNFFQFGGKLYIQNGHEYISWDGAISTDVIGWRPKIYVNTPPDGGGTPYELLNNLTGEKHQTFSPDGVKVNFQLAETNIDSLDFVKINGVLKILTTDYTVVLATGIVTFTVAPVGGTPSNVDIAWTKGAGDRASVLNNTFTRLYGGANNNRVLMFGNPSAKNRFIYSGLADGVPSAEYFPASNYNDVGSDEFALTDLVRQYDRLIIFTERDSYYSYYDTLTLEGVVTVSFPVYPLNQTKGNIAPGQAQLINNNPFTLHEGVYQWLSTNVRDERNALYISKRVQPSLDLVDLSNAITFDWEENGEYWLCVGSMCWIYNYRIDAWYKRSNVGASNFLSIDGELYFGTDGTIMKFAEQQTDNGVAIDSVWEMGFYDFGAEWLNKYMNNIWVALKPETKSSLDVQTVTNNEGTSVKQTISYNLATYAHVDYAHWSYNTSYSPQPFFIEVQNMGFSYFKVVLSNSTIMNTATVLSLNLPSRFGGKVR